MKQEFKDSTIEEKEELAILANSIASNMQNIATDTKRAKSEIMTLG